MKKMLSRLSLVLGIGTLLLMGCGNNTPQDLPTEINRPLAKDLEVYWELKENGYKNQSRSLTSFTIKNNSIKSLQRNWALYFHQPRKVDYNSVGENVKITHVSGDYFKLVPTDQFVDLKQGESVSLDFVNEAWFLKMVDAPTGIYIVFTDDQGKEHQPELIENITLLPMAKGDQLAIDGTKQLSIPTAQSLFQNNKLNQALSASELCPITPTPVGYEVSEGTFELKNGASIGFDKSLENEANFLVEKLGADYGIGVSLTEKEGAAITLLIDSSINVNGKTQSAYELIVNKDGVQLKGTDAAGVFYGIQSLRALFPVGAIAANLSELSLPAVTVKDAPRFEYRGVHLDVARNFLDKEAVLNYLDLVSFYKMNKFHFHICDDEGWRLEIEGLPELTEVGSKRGHTKDESDMLNPAYGSGPYPSAGSNGTGHYTKSDFVEILNFAKARHIEVIPELDFPGHARAAIVSMKAREKKLKEAGDASAAQQYVLHDANDSSTYTSVQLYNDNVVCVCQESTFDFLEKVVKEVVAMYGQAGLELKNVHIGGDEVPHPTDADPNNEVWIKSPKCQDFLAKDSTYNKASDLFYYFVDRFSDILQKEGITTAGWEEIGLKKVLNEDEDLVPTVNQKFIEKNFRPYIWNTVWNWGAEDRGYKLANAGYKVVLSNVNNLYFDLAYDKDPNDPGYYWGGFVDTKKSWSFIPFDFYSEKILDNFNNPLPQSLQEGKERLTEEGKKNILGIQGQLWSETVKGTPMMEYYLFPKMLGLVERAWAKDPNWSELPEDTKDQKIQEDWNVFSSKIGLFELQRLGKLNGGINYRVAPAGAIIEGGELLANTQFPGFEIRYTTDGSEPKATSTLYSGKVAVEPGVEIRLKVFSETGHASKTTVLK